MILSLFDLGFNKRKSNTFSSIAAANSVSSSCIFLLKVKVLRQLSTFEINAILRRTYSNGKKELSFHVICDLYVSLIESGQITCLVLFFKMKHHRISFNVILHIISPRLFFQQFTLISFKPKNNAFICLVFK